MPEILNHKLYLKLTSVENPVTLVLTAAEQVNGSSARECYRYSYVLGEA